MAFSDCPSNICCFQTLPDLTLFYLCAVHRRGSGRPCRLLPNGMTSVPVPNVHRSFLAQMNAHPRRSATDSLCLDPAQAVRPDRHCAALALPWPAGLVTRSVFQPEFLPQRRFELVPTTDSI